MNKNLLRTFALTVLIGIVGITSLNALDQTKNDVKAKPEMRRPEGPPPKMSKSLSLSSECQSAAGNQPCQYFTNNSAEWGGELW